MAILNRFHIYILSTREEISDISMLKIPDRCNCQRYAYQQCHYQDTETYHTFGLTEDTAIFQSPLKAAPEPFDKMIRKSPDIYWTRENHKECEKVLGYLMHVYIAQYI